jgi:hypothetical protein
MGIFSQCPARKFIEGITDVPVKEGAQALLTALFSSLGAQTVYLKSGLSREMRTSIEKETNSSLSGAFAPTEPERIESFSAREAPNIMATRMTHIPMLPGVSCGLSFGLEEAPSGPRTRWGLVLHRGPLLMLEIEIADGNGFKPKSGWAYSMVLSGAAHVCWDCDKGYLGNDDNLYLFLKRARLFPHSKGPSNEIAINAGLRLRQLCREIWSEQAGQGASPSALSSSSWRQKRFIKNFDRMLVDRIGREELAGLLTAMATDSDQWLQAGT